MPVLFDVQNLNNITSISEENSEEESEQCDDDLENVQFVAVKEEPIDKVTKSTNYQTLPIAVKEEPVDEVIRYTKYQMPDLIDWND